MNLLLQAFYFIIESLLFTSLVPKLLLELHDSCIVLTGCSRSIHGSSSASAASEVHPVPIARALVRSTHVCVGSTSDKTARVITIKVIVHDAATTLQVASV